MMVSKQPLFSGRQHADPEDRAAPGGREPANQSEPREAGAQRGTTHPGDPNLEIDLLDDDGGPRGGWRSSVAIVAVVAVLAGTLWYAYDWATGQLATTRLPVIVADTSPIKSHPESPGGIEVLNQDVAVLNDVVPDPAKPQAERLLPPPEAPQPPQAAAPQVETPQVEAPQVEAPQVEAPQVEAPQATSVAEVERLLGPPLDTAAGPPRKTPAAEEAPPPAAPAPVLPEPKAETMLVPEPPAEAPGAPAEARSAATSEPAPQVAAQVAALPDATTGGFVVQLAALRAKDGARPAWTRLQKAHPELLGDRELTIQKADLGDRGIFYRVQAGFFADRAGARVLCNALKARGQDCLVVKR